MKIFSWMILVGKYIHHCSLNQAAATWQWSLNLKPSFLSSRAGVFVTAALLLCLVGCTQETVQRFTGPTMGSTYTVSYVGKVQAQDLQRGVEEILGQLDAEVSTYREDSMLALFNAAPAGHCQEMPMAVATMLEQAQKVWHESAGALDVGLLPALSAWGFGPRGQVLRQPDAQALEQLRAQVGMRHFVWNGENLIASKKDLEKNQTKNSLCKTANAKLEFNSMAAGYAIDKIGDYLQKQGIQNYLIEVTGELAARGQKPDGSPWRIGIESPKMGELQTTAGGYIQAQRIIALNNMAISTSGDYRQYYEENGRRYSHILDPRTLAPIEHALASVTVAAASAMQADAWSTALMVMGPEAGLALAREKDMAAMFIVKNAQDFSVVTTPAFERHFGASK